MSLTLFKNAIPILPIPSCNERAMEQYPGSHLEHYPENERSGHAVKLLVYFFILASYPTPQSYIPKLGRASVSEKTFIHVTSACTVKKISFGRAALTCDVRLNFYSNQPNLLLKFSLCSYYLKNTGFRYSTEIIL